MNTCKKLFICILISFGILFIYSNNSAAYELTSEDKERMGPVGIELYNSWTEVLGYSAIDLVKEMDPAPEIKAGLVITPENAKNYPGLKKILPDTMYKRLDPNHFLPYKKMTIVNIRPRFLRKEIIQTTKANMGKCRINPDTLMIENFVAGIPFPHDPNPTELVWDHIINMSGGEDNLCFDPIASLNYSSARKLDSSWKANLSWYGCRGRVLTDFDPVTHESVYFQGKGMFQIGTLLLTYPQDLLGTAFLRYRYWETNKQDLFMSFLPGMKRIRVLSGSDCQDPMVGSEILWDTWGGDWQKQPSKNIFPNEYKILGKKIMLMPVYHESHALEIQGEDFITQWEKRPVWVLEVKSLDTAYVFSKRILYIDLEMFRPLYDEYFDRRGNLWKTWDDFRVMNYKLGSNLWEGVSAVNWESERHSVMPINAVEQPDLNPADFDMRWLTRMAR